MVDQWIIDRKIGS